MSSEHHCNPTKATHIDQELERFEVEATFKCTFEDEATTIHCYSIKKFTQVTMEKGECLLGYESPTLNIFYYQPGTMLFIAMHTSACDCNMCEWIYKPPSNKPKSPRHEPYQYG